MLKFFVVAVVGVCTLPCFASAQEVGSVMAEPAVAPIVDMQAVPMTDMQSAPMANMQAAPMNDMQIVGSQMMAAPAGDCGCSAPVSSCGCQDECAPRTRKKLALVSVQKTRCRLKLACTTDACGCSKRKLVREKVSVCRKRLTLVDAPARERCGCAGGRLKGLVAKLGSLGGGGCGCNAAPAPACGCDAAPAPACGCGN